MAHDLTNISLESSFFVFVHGIFFFLPFSLIKPLGACCALHVKPPKIADQAIFYSTNCQSSPFIVVFAARSGAKTYKRNRLLVYRHHDNQEEGGRLSKRVVFCHSRHL
jgi:hypothetical protein